MVAYALSPIDLIPDFHPGAGLCGRCAAAAGFDLADVAAVAARCADRVPWPRRCLDADQGAKPRSMAGAVLVVALWLLVGYAGLNAQYPGASGDFL